MGSRPAGGELDADHASIQTSSQLAQGVSLKVGIDDGVAADAGRVAALEGE
jgi:hypothetical protein